MEMNRIAVLREGVYTANQAIHAEGLAKLTWGNVSGYDPELGLMAIKPSGVDYSDLEPENIVFLDLDGRIHSDVPRASGSSFRPSSDTPSHLELYRSFPSVRGIVHTHSTYAVAWAQACTDIPIFGTTHADHMVHDIPCTPPLESRYVRRNYEHETGRQIVRHLVSLDAGPEEIEMILVGCHGPFTWASNIRKALENAVALEEIARMAYHTKMIRPDTERLPEELRQKHYRRKHGPDEYYGQKYSG